MGRKRFDEISGEYDVVVAGGGLGVRVHERPVRAAHVRDEDQVPEPRDVREQERNRDDEQGGERSAR